MQQHDKLRPAASLGILGDLNFLFGVGLPEFGSFVGVRFTSMGLFVLFCCLDDFQFFKLCSIRGSCVGRFNTMGLFIRG